MTITDMHTSLTQLAWVGSDQQAFAWCTRHLSRHIAIRNWPSIDDWLACPASIRSEYQRVAFALEYRDRKSLAVLADYHHAEPLQSICCVLGDSWLGHRRSLLSETQLPAMYWWNLEDRFLPWLWQGSPRGDNPNIYSGVLQPTDYWIEASEITQRWFAPAQNLFISTAKVPVESWQDFLQTRGGRSVHLSPSDRDLMSCLEQLLGFKPGNALASSAWLKEMQPTAVGRIWWQGEWCSTNSDDPTSTERSELQRLGELMHRFRLRYPYLEWGWITYLPSYQQWRQLNELGFEHLLVMPFRISGLLTVA